MENLNLKIPNPDDILDIVHIDAPVEKQDYYRDGVKLKKGAMLTKDYVDKNRAFVEAVAKKISVYPDLYIDLIQPYKTKFNLAYFQRFTMRECSRKSKVYVTAPRAYSKTFLVILILYQICITRPGIKLFICAPKKEQGAKIFKEKLQDDIWLRFPFLKREIVGGGNFGQDYAKLSFRNTSVFDCVSTLDTQRGGRRNTGLIDEVRDHDAESINNIVLPLMNVPRPMKNGVINPFEPQQCQFWMTSAGVRNSFAYDKLIEMLGFTILNPRRYSVIGCSYKVPLLAGVLSKDYLNEIKSSKTFSEASFAAEYLSLWQGTTKDSWVNFEKIARHRTLVNPEKAEKLTNDSKSFYIFSVDVARIGCQTVCTPIKVNPRDDGFKASLPNCFVLGKTDESKRFEIQALHLKRLIRDFNPREVVIDTNGLNYTSPII